MGVATGASLSDEQITTACELIAAGSSYRAASEQIGCSHMTLLAALHSDRHAMAYARAREIRAANDAQQIETDEAELRRLAQDVQAADGVDPQRAAQAIRALSETIGTRKWLAERRNQKLWGQRQQVEHTGRDGGPIELDDTSRVAKLQALLAKAEGRMADKSDQSG